MKERVPFNKVISAEATSAGRPTMQDRSTAPGANFFTYIASTNARPKLAKRGRSRQRRSDLHLSSLSLLVSRDGHIPLWAGRQTG